MAEEALTVTFHSRYVDQGKRKVSVSRAVGDLIAIGPRKESFRTGKASDALQALKNDWTRIGDDGYRTIARDRGKGSRKG